MVELCRMLRGFDTNGHQQLQTQGTWGKPPPKQQGQTGLGVVAIEVSRTLQGVELTFWTVNSTAVTIDQTSFDLILGSQNSLLIVT